MELIVIKKDSPEWEYMWNWLADHPYNKELAEPMIALNENEAWQYMGSFKLKERIIHEFRHRNHPITKDVLELKVTASPNMNEESILPKK